MWNEKIPLRSKTTTGNQSGEFYVTANELQFSDNIETSFTFTVSYDYDEQNNRGKFFAVKDIISRSAYFFYASGQVC